MLNTALDARLKRPGFILFELLIVIIISSMLMAAITIIYHGGIKSWGSGFKRYILKKELSRTLESMSQNLREANRIGQYSGIYTIEYDITEGDTTTTYCYYLYSPDASSDWAIEPDTVYQLKEALVSEADSERFWWWWWDDWWPLETRIRPQINNYGDGVVLLNNIVSPATSGSTTDLRYRDRMVVIDFLVNAESETLRMCTEVKPRNVQ